MPTTSVQRRRSIVESILDKTHISMKRYFVKANQAPSNMFHCNKNTYVGYEGVDSKTDTCSWNFRLFGPNVGIGLIGYDSRGVHYDLFTFILQ